MTRVLIIAGSDSSGGAGVTRDVETLTCLGVKALCALTAVTAQSDTAVTAVQVLPAHLVRAQIEAAFATAPVGAVKIGMLGTQAVVAAVAAALAARPGVPVVLDPVLVSTSGAPLLDAPGQKALREALLPRATLITPNIAETAALLARECAVSEQELLGQGRALLECGARSLLLKGGHGGGELATDLLLTAAGPVHRLSAPRIARSQRGTGCALASAIAARLAAGDDLLAACMRAKRHVSELLQHGSDT